MTVRNKIILASSIILALLVIGSVLVWNISSTNQSDNGQMPIVLLIGILTVSVLSVFVVYFSKIQKRKYEKLLNKEYYHQYEIIKDGVLNFNFLPALKKILLGIFWNCYYQPRNPEKKLAKWLKTRKSL